MPQAPLPPQEIIDRETPARRVAAYAAMFSALLTVIAMALEYKLSHSDIPDFEASDLVQTLAIVSDGGQMPRSFLRAVGEFRLDNNGINIAIWVLRGASMLLLIPMVQLLARAVRDRGGQVGAWVAPVSLVGLVVAALGTFAVFGILEPGIYRTARDAGFAPADVWDAVRDSPISTAQIVTFGAGMAIGLCVAFASVQAVRVGLLPRFIGYLGIVIGIMFVLPLDSSNFIRAAWFGALAFLVSGRLPEQTPPAWAAGTAVAPEPRQPAAPRDRGAGKGKKARAGK